MVVRLQLCVDPLLVADVLLLGLVQLTEIGGFIALRYLLIGSSGLLVATNLDLAKDIKVSHLFPLGPDEVVHHKVLFEQLLLVFIASGHFGFPFFIINEACVQVPPPS